MPKHRMKIGERGEIGSRQIGKGKWLARCYYRDSRGVRREATAQAGTKAASVTALKKKWSDLSDSIFNGVDNAAKITVARMAEDYFAQRTETAQRTGKPLVSTVRSQRQIFVKNVSPRIGAMSISEITTGVMARELNSMVGADGAKLATAKRCRSLLVDVFAHAVVHGVIRHNAAREIPDITYTPPAPEIWTPVQVTGIRAALALWARQPKVTVPVVEIFEVLMGTGARIGEILGVHWQNLELDHDRATVVMRIVVAAVHRRGDPGNRVAGTKTGNSRTLLLPPFAAEVLLRMHRDAGYPVEGLVFHTQAGGVYYTSMIREAFRVAMALGRRELPAHYNLPKVIRFHAARRTVLTEIAETSGLEAAQHQAGHTSLHITERHYVAHRPERIIDQSSAIGTRFAPAPDTH